jgi:hypothetical protein
MGFNRTYSYFEQLSKKKQTAGHERFTLFNIKKKIKLEIDVLNFYPVTVLLCSGFKNQIVSGNIKIVLSDA